VAKDTRRHSRLQLPERLRDWLNSPQERALRELARQLAVKVDLTPPRPKAKRTRKKGAGAKPRLTPEQIEHGRKVYRRELKKDGALKKHDAALTHLRPLLNLAVSDTTLLRHIIRPVLSE
jgi:hypothetical protein